MVALAELFLRRLDYGDYYGMWKWEKQSIDTFCL